MPLTTIGEAIMAKQKPGKPEPAPMKEKPMPKKRIGSKFKKYQEQMEKGPGE